MALCRSCGEQFSAARHALGYNTCLTCGDRAAQRETERKKKCIAPAYNKGAYQYVGSAEQCSWLGRK